LATDPLRLTTFAGGTSWPTAPHDLG